MSSLRHDAKVLGYLGRALSMELSAVQQYSTQARLVAAWGLSEAADIFETELQEEIEHANRIIDRMLIMGVAPNSSQLRPVKLAGDLFGLLQHDKQLESDIIRLYRSASQHCARVGDHDSRAFFEQLVNEEWQHHAELETWISRLARQHASA